ncbi:MAG: hypothetical protein CVT67_09400 [Actinobacteria bacterium HGW-Actinobacteria-7]|nr:MAG: hypothetical protein CVT67_09400 [Actinobacteria bacterium HGW-Actinobacteria-7]
MVVPDLRGSNVNRLQQVLAVGTAALIVAVCVCGCAGPGAVYVDSASAYTPSNIDTVFAQVGSDYQPKGKPTADSSELRHRALVELRGEGPGATSAADLITTTFPADTRGVPIYVEKATFDGTPAILLLEATGRAGGNLDDLRLWVVGETGDILYSQLR